MNCGKISRNKLYIAFISVSIFIVLLTIKPFHRDLLVTKPRAASCHFTNRTQNQTVKYIFDLASWRNLLTKDSLSWCVIPTELQLIANALCRFYKVTNCTRLPCQMIYSSPSTIVDIHCRNDGRMMTSDNHRTTSDLQCRRGISLDLFIKQANHSSYPSIIADPFSPITTDLHVAVLHNQYRSCDSMWGVLFNFESLSYYPWTGDREKMKLFDATFGYDRSVYDFTPQPWLFNYVDRITLSPNRLSMHEVMRSKKVIHSETPSDVYWTNIPTVSAEATK